MSREQREVETSYTSYGVAPINEQKDVIVFDVRGDGPMPEGSYVTEAAYLALRAQLAAAERERDEFRTEWDRAMGYWNKCGERLAEAEKELQAERDAVAAFISQNRLLRTRAERAEVDAAGVVNVLGFFASCIKSGEPWTDECDKMLRAAFAHRDGQGA